MWILILILAILLLIGWCRIRKIPKIGTLTFINGGVKTGKSALSVYFALRCIKRNRLKWHIKCFLIRLFKFLRFKKFKDKQLPEKPCLYSNIPIGQYPYVPLTEDLIVRKKRFAYGSVIYLDENSLVADSMEFDDKTINERLQLFVKLIGHELQAGGTCITNSQAVRDMHFSFKRCITNYYYIHHDWKFIPFFVFLWVREERYGENGNVTNVYEDDLEHSGLRCIIMPKKVWKQYDRFAFSYLTDKLPIENTEIYLPKGSSLKANRLVSFKKFRTISNVKGELKNENSKKT